MTEEIYRIRYCTDHWERCCLMGQRANWDSLPTLDIHPMPHPACGVLGCHYPATWIEKPFDEHGRVVE